MSSNFLNNSAIMAGLDMHKFMQLAPPPTLNVPIPMLHFVGLPFFWPPATFWNRTGKVTADTWQMIDVDFSLLLVPHTALGGIPGPAQPVNLLEITATSGSEASLGIGSVTGEGDPLAACILGPVGLNLNCWEVGDHPSGLVLCVCSVKTKPSLLDYALALLKWHVVGFMGEAWGKFFGPLLAKLIRKVPAAVFEFIVKQIVINLMEQVAVLIRWIVRKLGY